MTKPTLILLPGLLCDAALWAHQVAALADVCDPVVGDLTKDDSMAAMAERILNDAPDRFYLAGLSMGGYVAQQIMRVAPERVDRLALIDTNARADTAEQRKTRQGLIRLSQMGRFKGVTPRLLPNLIHPSRMDDPAVAGVVLAMGERIGQEAFARQQTAIMNRVDGRGDLVAIRVPALVLCGRQDLISPVEFHREMVDAIAGAKLAVIEDCGHLAPLERPAEVNAAMRAWLS